MNPVRIAALELEVMGMEQAMLPRGESKYLLNVKNHEVLGKFHGSLWQKKSDMAGVYFEMMPVPDLGTSSECKTLEERVEAFQEEEQKLAADLGEFVSHVKRIVELANKDGVQPSQEAEMEFQVWQAPSETSSAQDLLQPQDVALTDQPNFARVSALKAALAFKTAAPAESAQQVQKPQRKPMKVVRPEFPTQLESYFQKNPSLNRLVVDLGEGTGQSVFMEVRKLGENNWSIRSMEMQYEYGPEKNFNSLKALADALERGTQGKYRMVTSKRASRLLWAWDVKNQKRAGKKQGGSIEEEALNSQIADLIYKWEFKLVPMKEELFRTKLQDLLKKRDNLRKVMKPSEAEPLVAQKER